MRAIINVDNVLLSEEIINEYFCCDIEKCKGICCVEGDAGAPLLEEEIGIMEDLKDVTVDYAQPEGKAIIDEKGVFDFDMDGSYVTPLVNQKECAFVYFENGIAMCAIEKAFEKGETNNLSDDNLFNKPISCYLYPIREMQLSNAVALNYHKWDVCKNAVEKGEKEHIRVYQFLKKPLIRRFGEDWYRKLEQTAEAYLLEQRNLINT